MTSPAESSVTRRAATAPMSLAERLKGVFEIDTSVCPFCSDTLRVIADVTDPDAIQTILKQRAPPDNTRPQTRLPSECQCEATNPGSV